MDIQVAPEAVKRPLIRGRGVERRWGLSHFWVMLMADRVVPAMFFLLLLAIKGPQLRGLLVELEAARGLVRWQLYASLANYGLTCIFFLVVIGLFVLRRSPLRKEQGLWERGVAVGATLVPMAIGVAPATQSGMVVSLLASFLIMVGLAIALTGFLSLRTCFGILPEVRGMVTDGLYRHLRHPVYLGEGVASLGITLLVLSPLTASMLLLFLFLEWRRALSEEAILGSVFHQYREYAGRTKQFIPGLW